MSFSSSLEPDSLIIASYRSILRLEGIEKTKATNEDAVPVHAFDAWLKHTRDALEVVFWEDASRFSALEKFHKQSESLLKQTTLSPEWNAFLGAEMDLQLAFTRLKMGKEWAAAWQIRSAFLELRQVQKEHPDFGPVYKSLGLLEIVLSLAPSQYQWVLNILGMKADMEQGRRHLQRAFNDPLVGEEAHFWQATVSALLFDEVESGLAQLQQLPPSRMKAYLMHHLLMKNASAEEAMRLMEGEELSLYPPQIYHSMGMAALQKADWTLAEHYFKAFLQQCSCQHLVKSTYFRLYQLAIFQNDTLKAQSFRQKVEASGQAVAEADRLALRELKEGMHPFLIQARLSTDGGYAEEATQWLHRAEAIRAENPDWEAEWRYRRARLLHLMGDECQAYEAYRFALELATDDGNYIFANAALKAAEIAADRGNLQESRLLYMQAISFKNHPYVSSVETKAKYGLGQLRE